MKRIFILLLATAPLVACTSSDKKVSGTDLTKDSSGVLVNNGPSQTSIDSATANATTIEWVDSTYIDLGKQKEGKEIEISFRFKNTGSKNLVIENVTAGCGCTIPEKPEQPFAPGEEGVIKAKFNGAGHGETRKQVTVTANTSPSPTHVLTFRAELGK